MEMISWGGNSEGYDISIQPGNLKDSWESQRFSEHSHQCFHMYVYGIKTQNILMFLRGNDENSDRDDIFNMIMMIL